MSKFKLISKQLFEFFQSFPGGAVSSGQTQDGQSTLIKISLPIGKSAIKIITIQDGKTTIEYISESF